MERLDTVLVRRGLAQSRQRATTLIRQGNVEVDGIVRTKPSFSVTDEMEIHLLQEDIPYVGRGGLKLAYVMEQEQIDLGGQVCMDIGASTGGFTECMLLHGAKQVYSVDVGHGQLAEKLREHPAVVNLEGTDIRNLHREDLENPIDFFSVDVSFISLKLVVPAIIPLLSENACGILLIKPQFEVGKKYIGKNGIVKDMTAHKMVLEEILTLLNGLQLGVQELYPSPIHGGSGNTEYLVSVAYHAQGKPITIEKSFVEKAITGK